MIMISTILLFLSSLLGYVNCGDVAGADVNWFASLTNSIGYNEIYTGGTLVGEKEKIEESSIPDSSVTLRSVGAFAGTIIHIEDSKSRFEVLTVAHDVVNVAFLHVLQIGPWLPLVASIFFTFIGSIHQRDIRPLLSWRPMMIVIIKAVIAVKTFQFFVFLLSIFGSSNLIVYKTEYGGKQSHIGYCHLQSWQDISIWYDYCFLICESANKDSLNGMNALTPVTENKDESGSMLSIYAVSTSGGIESQFGIDTESAFPYQFRTLNPFETAQWYHVHGFVKSMCKDEWGDWLFGCYTFHSAPLTPRMSGAACLINGKFTGMVHGGGTIYNPFNRCVSFSSNSFKDALQSRKAIKKEL